VSRGMGKIVVGKASDIPQENAKVTADGKDVLL